MFRSLLAAAAILVAAQGAASAQTLRALTADTLSPFSRAEADALPGFNVELMRAIAEEAGVELVIEWMPWKRAQAMVEEGPDLLLFGATRNAAREETYDWVTNLLTVENVFLTSGAAIDSFEAAEGLAHIAARSVYYDELVERGFTNVEEGLIDANLRKMRAGRVDAVYTVASRAMFEWVRMLGFPEAELTIGAPVKTSDIWLAASKGYDRDVIRRLDEAQDVLRANGTYAALYAKYFGDLPVLERAKPDLLPTGETG
jgi:polar amino acid transport system substrate-binding protein